MYISRDKTYLVGIGLTNDSNFDNCSTVLWLVDILVRFRRTTVWQKEFRYVVSVLMRT